MVWHDDSHGVDIAAGEQLAKIGVDIAAFELARARRLRVMIVHRFLSRLAATELLFVAIAEAGPIHVAHRYDLSSLLMEKELHHLEAAVAGADQPDGDSIARSVRPEHRSRDDIRSGERRGAGRGRAENFAAGQRHGVWDCHVCGFVRCRVAHKH